MPRIHLLDSTVADQIAAGEVVERPSSVVKELVENSLDAAATQVRVDLEEGGRKLIRVSDDGEGMDAEDLVLSLRRHATSKIQKSDDLQSLTSFGFRGEALPSIASVSLFRLSSRASGADEGHAVQVDGGQHGQAHPEGRSQGTTVEVRRLFYNTPARLKFLKTDGTETGRAQADLSQMALARPDVAFKLSVDGKATLDLPATPAPAERLRQLWGASLASQALRVNHEENGIRVHGWVSPPQLSRGNRTGQWLYVNGRNVEHRQLGFHLSQAFGSLLPHGRHAVAALFLELGPELVDVNVHPAKKEVRFRREGDVLGALRHGVTNALNMAQLFAGVTLAPRGEAPPPSLGGAGLPYPSDNSARLRPGSPTNYVVGEGLPPLFERAVTTATPSHVGPSGLGMVVPQAVKADWPVPLAQLHKMYLLCQDAQGLVLVDQHAAHERVLYERQLKAWAQGQVKSQRLLLPQRVTVSEAQAVRLREWIEPLAALGLELQDVGGGLFFIGSLPEFMKQVQAAAMLQDLLEQPDVDSQPDSGDPAEDFRREAAAQLACKAAIKAGDMITWEAMQHLMADLSACEIPWSCPHGRPPLVRLSLFELEKYFQRR